MRLKLGSYTEEIHIPVHVLKDGVDAIAHFVTDHLASGYARHVGGRFWRVSINAKGRTAYENYYDTHLDAIRGIIRGGIERGRE